MRILISSYLYLYVPQPDILIPILMRGEERRGEQRRERRGAGSIESYIQTILEEKRKTGVMQVGYSYVDAAKAYL